MIDEPDRPDDPVADAEADRPRWNSTEVMRRRAANARSQRDASIDQLRESMTDEEARDEFGIDLREIEK
jgi:hypothetical protein